MNKDQMRNTKNQPNGLTSTRKFKYGSVSISITAIFVAVLVIFNVIFSALANKFGFYLDLTTNQIYGVSDATTELLKDIDTEIKIKFCMPLDSLESDETYKLVLTCAQEYERRFDNISIEYCDIISDPAALKYYKDKGYTMSTMSIIVESEYRCKVFQIKNCFVYAESTGNVYGFKGEQRFTSMILAVANEHMPVVSFTQGHGETVPLQLEEMFTESGYDVQKVNLATEDISDETRILIISDPQKDFSGLFTSGAAGKSEIDKLTEYINSRRHIMLFVDKDTPKMPELDAVLEEWGIVINYQTTVMDEEKCINNAPNTVVCQYADSYAKQLHESISSLESPPNTITIEAVPISLLFGEEDENVKATGAILKTHPSSYIMKDGERQHGEYTVMGLATKMEYVDNVQTNTHIFVCGSTTFTELTYAASYGNNDIIFNVIGALGKTSTTVDIEWKRTDDDTLKIDSEIATNLTIVLSAVIPSIVLVCGLAVAIVRRKHR